ncbi:polyprenyl synthetase family protein [Bacteroidetes bacterium endosymbiont of Geopemphigus sp.]|uniref:polyprenyl synthetase family protein n=1 Tax=Bacteroidetes bacterium endosymbiont of Geopemphigus sp. TaxID=2047937 RepID=UPI000CD160D2|nr:polyprenyl synthetase family protein [Bacteroidetes bacterium endosymbiont of Geopemphigus sp.]
MKSLSKYQLLIEEYIKKNFFDKMSENIYEPINYVLSMTAKRVRPSLCLLATEIFEGDIYKALKPAVALEFFHNFTLIHDDIMDKAPLRRGNLSVHKKWNETTAILSGDLLLIKAYQLLEGLEPELFYKIVRELSNTGVKVCEGQQMDMSLEENSEAIFQQYIEMIQHKTAALIGSALKTGALLAEACEEDANHLYETGKNIGIAFQIQDDLLDVFGQTERIGKKHAGDIYGNKKTILYFKTLAKAKEREREELFYWYSIRTDNIDKIYAVEQIFKKLHIGEEVKKELIRYRQKSLDCLSKVTGNKEKKQALIEFLDESLIRLY